MKTHWLCEACGKSDKVEHDEHADISEVHSLIFDSHKRLSGDCAYSPWNVRVMYSELDPKGEDEEVK